MSRVRYSVAMSLDGFIAGSNGEYDWIVMDPAIDFAAFTSTIDAIVMGRATYEMWRSAGSADGGFGEIPIYVVSTTLDPDEHPDVTVVTSDAVGFVAELKERSGRDIWLFGGGILFRTLLEAGLVDRVEVGVVPVLLGRGLPVLPGLAGRAEVNLHSQETFPSGIVLIKYDVVKEGEA